MLKRITAWVRRIVYRYGFNAGRTMALGMLRDGWTRNDVLNLPAMCPSLYPSQAFVDGFYDALKLQDHSRA